MRRKESVLHQNIEDNLMIEKVFDDNLERMVKRNEIEIERLRSDVSLLKDLLLKNPWNEESDKELCAISRSIYIGVNIIDEINHLYSLYKNDSILPHDSDCLQKEIISLLKETISKAKEEPYRNNVRERLSELEPILEKWSLAPASK
jgi:hypothetical protein